MARDIEVVVCRSGHRRFGLRVEEVVEVARMVAIDPIPDSVTWMAGLIDYRGRVAPVIDLSSRIGAGSRSDDPNARIVICSWEGRPFGLIVDEVEEVARTSSSSVGSPEAISENEDVVAEAVRVNDHLVLMLEISGLSRELFRLIDSDADFTERHP